jgi:DNA-directed RNA polymerase specialized sigma24 family protein
METLTMTSSKINPMKGVSLEKLYKSVFPSAAKFVSGKGGSFDDAKDIFQEALVIYLEKKTNKKFVLRDSAEVYILGIAKHLWYHKFKHDLKNTSLDEVSHISIPDDPSPSTAKLLELLENTGKRCLNLLRAYYFEKVSVTKISERFGYSSVHSASVQKFKCLEKIRNTIKEKSIRHEDFFE